MEKSEHQKKCESGYYGINARKYERMKCIKESNQSDHKVGEIVTVVRWGTFGCWDEKNRWVDFYCFEQI